MAKVLADKAAQLARSKHAPKQLHLQAQLMQANSDAELDETLQREHVLKGELAAEGGHATDLSSVV